MLVHADGLAKVSKTPGHTQMINFYDVNKGAWTLVDLPGYGYAKIAKSERERFNEFVSDYVTQRSNLAGLFILIDAKIPPQKLDLEFTHWVVECGIPFTLIWTKTDRVKPAIFKKNKEDFLKMFAEACDGEPHSLACSAKTGDGRGLLLSYIEQALSKR